MGIDSATTDGSRAAVFAALGHLPGAVFGFHFPSAGPSLGPAVTSGLSGVQKWFGRLGCCFRVLGAFRVPCDARVSALPAVTLPPVPFQLSLLPRTVGVQQLCSRPELSAGIGPAKTQLLQAAAALVPSADYARPAPATRPNLGFSSAFRARLRMYKIEFHSTCI